MVSISIPFKLKEESMLSLGNGPPQLPCIAAIKSTLRPQANKLHSNLGHTSLSLVSSWRSRPHRQVFLPMVVRALDGAPIPSSNGKNHCHQYLQAALKSLLDITASLASGKVEPPAATSDPPSMRDVDNLKMQAVRLMKNGKADDAVDFLQNEYNKYMLHPEPACNVEMALVEILICQGKYKEALERKCLKDDPCLPSDARFPLYKAIIYTMLDDKENARTWWEKYLQSVEEGFDPSSIEIESSE